MGANIQIKKLYFSKCQISLYHYTKNSLVTNNKNHDEDYNPRYRKQRKKVCVLCSDKNFELDYKNPEQLRKFINDKGKILPRRTTGACAKHQRDITIAVKRARHIAMLPYSQN